jgi:hypothetical protein
MEWKGEAPPEPRCAPEWEATDIEWEGEAPPEPSMGLTASRRAVGPVRLRWPAFPPRSEANSHSGAVRVGQERKLPSPPVGEGKREASRWGAGAADSIRAQRNREHVAVRGRKRPTSRARARSRRAVGPVRLRWPAFPPRSEANSHSGAVRVGQERKLPSPPVGEGRREASGWGARRLRRSAQTNRAPCGASSPVRQDHVRGDSRESSCRHIAAKKWTSGMHP